MKKNLLLSLVITFLFSAYTKAQVLLRESGDTALIMKLMPKRATANRNLKTFEIVTDLTKEKSIIDTAKIPYHFGKPINKTISITDGTSWVEGDSLYTTLKISSPESTSLSLSFGKFVLSESAIMYVYNEGHTMLLGPITSKQNNKKGTYGTSPLSGSSIFLLLIEKYNGGKKPISEIVTSKVIVGYKEINGSLKNGHKKNINEGNFRTSGSCMIDIACYPDWDGSPTAKYFANGEQCTGSLLNNENRDGRPLFLSAFHCIDSDDDGMLQSNEIIAVSDYVFQFFYRKETCSGSTLFGYLQFYGANLLASFDETDFALVELSDIIPIESNINFYGWNRSNSSPSSGASIHHPSGDVQKISIANFIQTSTFSGNMWGVEWQSGATEGGSSGAPLFNGAKQVIGQLRGGSSSCNSPLLNDRFGKFSKSWDSQIFSHRQLKFWLSPSQNLSEMTALDRGLITGSTNISFGQNYTYTMPNMPSQYTITWSASPQLNIVSTTSNSVIVTSICSGEGYVRAWYNNVLLREYKINISIPPISGPSQICTTGTYSISNVPVGATVTWSSSNNLMASISTNSNVGTLTKVSDGVLTLTANIITSCGNIILTKEITLGPPVINPISYDYGGNTYSPLLPYLTVPNNPVSSVNSNVNVNFTLNGATSAYVQPISQSNSPTITHGTWFGLNGGSFYFEFNEPNEWVTFKLTASNACGSSTYDVAFYGPSELGRFAFWPNPASSELKVAFQYDLGIDRSKVTIKNYEAKLLNNRGQIVRSVKNSSLNNEITFDVQALPNDIYYLHILDGKKTIKKQVVIRH